MKCEKVRFGTEKFAMEHIKILKKNSVRKKIPIRAYACQKCGGWHLTSRIEITLTDNGRSEIKKLEEHIEALRKSLTTAMELKNYYKQKYEALLNEKNI